MVKVLIYSSKEIYENSSYEGRAEADIIAYSIDQFDYTVIKNRYYSPFCPWNSKANLENFGKVSKYMLKRHIEKLEKDDTCNHYENGKPIHICVDGNVK